MVTALTQRNLTRANNEGVYFVPYPRCLSSCFFLSKNHLTHLLPHAHRLLLFQQVVRKPEWKKKTILLKTIKNHENDNNADDDDNDNDDDDNDDNNWEDFTQQD